MIGAGVAARLSRLQYVSGILFGVALMGFALVGAFVPALALVAVVGGASAAYSAVNSSLLMGQTPAEYHGRVMGVYMMTFAAMPLSSLPAAWVAEQVGLPATLAVCGALSALVVALLGRRACSGRRPCRWRRVGHGSYGWKNSRGGTRPRAPWATARRANSVRPAW